MKGWHIFSHSISLVWRNMYQALQIGLVPVVILVGLVTLLVPQIGMEMGTTLRNDALKDAVQSGQISLFPIFLIVLLWVLITIWVFVSWHRYVLMEEYPKGWIPAFRTDRILSYVGHGLKLMLLMFCISVLVVLLVVVTGGIAFVLFLAVAVIIYRFVAIFPAAAIGEPLTLREAWNATKGSTGSIIVMLLLFFVLQLVLSGAIAAMQSIAPILGLASQMTVTLFMSLVNVSVMTTFYGHYVQGRPIG
jgi:hypothetical protein